jgi:Tfp pilus assembly protein PilN
VITINFASRNYRLIALATKGIIAGSVLLTLGAAMMLGTSVSLRRDISLLDQKLRNAETADEQIQPVLGEREQLVKDLSAMSDLLETRRFSWTRFLTDIEAIVPRGVAMKHVEFAAHERTVSFEGAAQSPEALRNLIVGLERSPSFKDPFLKHQSLEKGNISFNVVAVYHDNAGIAVAQGKKE